MLTVGSKIFKTDIEKGIPGSHAFTVLDTRELSLENSKIRLIQLRNPWGDDTEWKGEWGNKSQELTPRVKAILGYEPKIGNGIFWIKNTDFEQYFDQICCCYLEDKFSFFVVKSSKNSKNFKYQFKVFQDSKMYIIVQQKSKRHFASNYSYSPIQVEIYDIEEPNKILYNKAGGSQSTMIKETMKKGMYGVNLTVDWNQTIYNLIVVNWYSEYAIESFEI